MLQESVDCHRRVSTTPGECRLPQESGLFQDQLHSHSLSCLAFRLGGCPNTMTNTERSKSSKYIRGPVSGGYGGGGLFPPTCLMAVLVLQVVLARQVAEASLPTMIRSKLGDLYKLRKSLEQVPALQLATTAAPPPPPPPNTQLRSASVSALSSDDVYSGLSHLLNKNEHYRGLPASGLAARPQEHLNLFSEVNMGNFPENSVHNETVEDVLPGEDVPEEHWARIKSILGNMKSILEQMYPAENSNEKVTFSFIDKAMAVGDKVHLLQRMQDTFDNDLLGFLRSKWESIRDTVVNSHPILQVATSSSTRELGKHLMMGAVRQLGHLLHSQAFTHLSELDFVTELMRSSGFKDLEIHEVFNLLGLPTDIVENVMPEARQLGYSSTVEKSGGYGHSGGAGGYGGGQMGGYGQMGGGYMQSFDPFVLLAGLAFATFLAYLIYRLLSSTAAGRRREAPDISLALDLSDLPEVVGNLYNWLENTENTYAADENTAGHETRSFSLSANQLWTSFQVDRLSHACVKRYMCDYTSATTTALMEPGSVLEQLALTGLAQLFGEEDSAPLVDKIQSQVLNGRDVHCDTIAPQCDDTAYQGVRSQVVQI
nr:uncharacterized protein LOC123771687 [Procambarus clarkii]